MRCCLVTARLKASRAFSPGLWFFEIALSCSGNQVKLANGKHRKSALDRACIVQPHNKVAVLLVRGSLSPQDRWADYSFIALIYWSRSSCSQQDLQKWQCCGQNQFPYKVSILLRTQSFMSASRAHHLKVAHIVQWCSLLIALCCFKISVTYKMVVQLLTFINKILWDMVVLEVASIMYSMTCTVTFYMGWIHLASEFKPLNLQRAPL